MENATPPSHSSNPNSRTLLHNSTNHVNQTTQKKAMDNFQEFIFKLAGTHPNKPLTPATKTLLQGRLNRFVSEYKTPDHPPYSAMIQSALRELNEKGGSSEESISQHLEKRYDNLPWAHTVFLKQHLEKLCESGESMVTRDNRYALPGCLNSSTEVKRKPSRRKWRYDCERLRNYWRKKKSSEKRNRRKYKEDEHDEKEQQLTENGARSEDRSDQTKRLLSCADGENGVCSDPSFFVRAANKTKYSEEVRSKELEIGPSENVKAEIQAVQTQGLLEKEQSEYSQPELLSSPERPPGFESIRVENLPHLGLIGPEVASTEEFIGSPRMLRQLKRWSRMFPEPKAVTVTSSEFSTSPEFNTETSQDQQKTFDSTPIAMNQMNHEEQQSELPNADAVEVVQSVMNDSKLKRDEKYGGRRKNNSRKSETIGIHVSEHPLEPYTKIDSPNLSLTLNRQEDISQGKQLPWSLRPRPAKPEVAKDANFVSALLPQPCPEECPKTVHGSQSTPSRRRPGNQPPREPIDAACTDELKHPPKCRRSRVLLKPKPDDAADVENLRAVDDRRRQADCTPKMERPRRMQVLLPRNRKQKLQPTKRRPRRPPKFEVA